MALPALLLPRTSSSFLCNPLRTKLLPRQLVSDFSGQKLRISKSFTKYTIHAPYFAIRVQLNKSNGSLSHDLIENSEHCLDDLSDWISKKIAEIVRPHLPENFDVLEWIPSNLQSRIQSVERAPRFIALDKVLSLLMYYIAGTCIGEVSGFALRSVLAIGGVSGIAVGLAAKEIVGNFLGGALLFITRPFVIGDRVKSDSFEGWVEDIDFLYTKVRGYDQSPLLIPNSAIMNEIIINHSRAKCRQLVAVFILRNEDIFLVDKITEEITDYLINHRRVDLVNGPKPFCYLKNMGPEGLEIELLCSIGQEGSEAFFFKAKQEILVKVAKIVTSVGACFESNASVVLMKEGGAPTAEAA